MKVRSVRELTSMLAMLLPGGVGTYIVARTLASYWGHDGLASLIVLAIGAALLVGLAEVFVRYVRAQWIERELRALPAVATEATVDGSSPVVSAMLRARLEQQHGPVPGFGENIAPFLTGLLVMLGLLGTLLGLFQTVHGAGAALTNSGDIDTLRHSLSLPIEGLTRSFGCSAAGISASAMLGLAVALVRRREAAVLRVFNQYAAGPLRVLSPARRQALALEQLASQGLAMPSAADAIAGVGSKLDALSQQLVSLQETSLKAQHELFKDVASGARAELANMVVDAGAALQQRVAPLFEQMATRSSQALAAQAEALTHSARELSREIERDVAARREETAEQLERMGASFAAAESARSSAHARELETVMGLASRMREEAEEREQGLSERWQALVGRLDAQLEHAQSSAAERRSELEQREKAAGEQHSEQLARLDGVTTRVGSELERLSSALSAQLEQRLGAEASQQASAQRAFTQLEAAAQTVERGVGRQEAALESLVERLPTRFEEAAQSSRQAAQQALADLAALTEQRLSQVTSLLTDELTQRGDSARSLGEQAAQTLARVEQSAGVLDAAIDRQGQGLEQLITRVGTLLPEIVQAAQAGAAATLTQLQDKASEQAERFSELEAALSRGRETHASALAEQLTGHAQGLEQRLAAASETVHEAAAIWQASSAEMQAVAELFTQSVERQREAADTWLESLGEVEGAVERAGQRAAGASVADQLAATQEVFARQLQFQREMFDQLRALRQQVLADDTVVASDHEHDDDTDPREQEPEQPARRRARVARGAQTQRDERGEHEERDVS